MGHASVRQGAVRCEQSEDCNGFYAPVRRVATSLASRCTSGRRRCHSVPLSFPPATAPRCRARSLHLTVPPCRRNPFLQRSRFLYLDLIRWDRPGWLVCLWPTLSALWIAADGFPGWHLLAVFVLGTFLMRSAGCCVNDVADRDFDKHVKRTAQRPVTTGAVSVKEALGLGAVLALVSFGLCSPPTPPPSPGRCPPCWWPLPTRSPSASLPCPRRCWVLRSTSAS